MSRTVQRRAAFTLKCHGDECLATGKRFSEQELHFCQSCGDQSYCALCRSEYLHRESEFGKAYCGNCFVDIASRHSLTGDYLHESEWIDVFH